MTLERDWHDAPIGGGCEATCTANLAKLILPANATWMGAARCEADAPVNDCPTYDGSGGGGGQYYWVDHDGDSNTPNLTFDQEHDARDAADRHGTNHHCQGGGC